MFQIVELRDLEHGNTVMHLQAISAPNCNHPADDDDIEDAGAFILLQVHEALTPAEEIKFPSTILTFLSPPAAEKLVSFVLSHVAEATDRETLELWKRWLLDFSAEAAEDAAINRSSVLGLIVEICLRCKKDI